MPRVRISVPLLADPIACLLALLIVFWTPSNILFKATHAHSPHVLCTLTILFFVLGLHYYTPAGPYRFSLYRCLCSEFTAATLFTIIVFCLIWTVFCHLPFMLGFLFLYSSLSLYSIFQFYVERLKKNILFMHHGFLVSPLSFWL